MCSTTAPLFGGWTRIFGLDRVRSKLQPRHHGLYVHRWFSYQSLQSALTCALVSMSPSLATHSGGRPFSSASCKLSHNAVRFPSIVSTGGLSIYSPCANNSSVATFNFSSSMIPFPTSREPPQPCAPGLAPRVMVGGEHPWLHLQSPAET